MTLLEVMIALVVLAIGLIGMIPFSHIAIMGNTAARQTTEATLLVQEKLEEFRRITAYTLNPSSTLASLLDTNGNTNLDAVAVYDCATNAADACETVSRTGLRRTYTRFWNIADSSPRADMKTVKVHVIWIEGIVPHDISATTVIAAKDRRFY